MNISFLLGATSNSTTFDRIGVSSNDQQVFDFFDHSGFVNQTPIEYHEKKKCIRSLWKWNN